MFSKGALQHINDLYPGQFKFAHGPAPRHTPYYYLVAGYNGLPVETDFLVSKKSLKSKIIGVTLHIIE